MIEDALRKRFPRSDAYRFNSASIRIRVIDDAFRRKTEVEREKMVDPILDQLPDETQSDIMMLLTMTPDEARTPYDYPHYMMHIEFENPQESTL